MAGTADSRNDASVLVVGASTEAQAVHRCLVREHVATSRVESPEAAARSIDDSAPGIIVVDVDEAPAEAVELCRSVKRNIDTRLTPIVVLSDDREREQRLAALATGAEAVLSKPFDPEELLVRVKAFSRVSHYANDLESAAAIIMTVTAMIEARESSPGHCYRMANYATALGRAMRLSADELKALYRGAFLHDIGMLSIPDGILHKGGRLEPEEYEIIKSHAVIGDALCANLRTLHSVRPIVRHHHERLDGSGYPDGLRGDAVPLLAQIVSIVDLFEAITMGREYVAPRAAVDAIKVLRHETSVGWRRPEVVEPFIALVGSGALEKFRAAAVTADEPLELAGLATDLQHAASSVGAPVPHGISWSPHH
ncbi:MAG: HD domain-containing phosphohydrolase [Acidobacteriota bacterium]